MKTLVMKFGGTSVGSADAISQAVALIAEHAPAWDQTAVVVSAMRGVTDALIEGAVTAARGDDQTYRGIVSDLRVRHTLEVAGLLADPATRTSLLREIDTYLDEYSAFCRSVHVLGEVASPGVVRLPQGSRVEDAIAAAGGLTPEARPGELNLAAPVVDGGQVVIGDGRNPGGEMRAGAAPGAGGGAGGGGSGKLDLNTATADQLDGLPGVGPVTASAILAWREQHERFSRVEELLEIEGIGTKTFQRLEPLVTV